MGETKRFSRGSVILGGVARGKPAAGCGKATRERYGANLVLSHPPKSNKPLGRWGKTINPPKREVSEGPRMEVGSDAGMRRCCLLSPAAGSSKEPCERHGWMLDLSRSRLCSGSLDGVGWGHTAPGRSSHETLGSPSPLPWLSFSPLFLNKINKYNLTLILTLLINV